MTVASWLLPVALILSGAHADPSANKVDPPAKDNTLQFQDELIEGKDGKSLKEREHDKARIASPIFIDLSSANSVDSIVFRRSNFADFHEVDKKTRLQIQMSDRP